MGLHCFEQPLTRHTGQQGDIELLPRFQDSRERTREHLGPPTVPCGRVIYVRRLKAGSEPLRYDAVWVKAEVSSCSWVAGVLGRTGAGVFARASSVCLYIASVSLTAGC